MDEALTIDGLLAEIARPKPEIIVMLALPGMQCAVQADPVTGKRFYAMSRELYCTIDDRLMLQRGDRICNHAHIQTAVEGTSFHIALLRAPGAEPCELVLEPRPIGE